MKQDIAIVISFLACWFAVWFCLGIYPLTVVIIWPDLTESVTHFCWFDSYRGSYPQSVGNSVAAHIVVSFCCALMSYITGYFVWLFLRSVKSKLFS